LAFRQSPGGVFRARSPRIDNRKGPYSPDAKKRGLDERGFGKTEKNKGVLHFLVQSKNFINRSSQEA